MRTAMFNANPFNCMGMPNNYFPASFGTPDASSTVAGVGGGARPTQLFHEGNANSFGAATQHSSSTLPSFHQNYQNNQFSGWHWFENVLILGKLLTNIKRNLKFFM